MKRLAVIGVAFFIAAAVQAASIDWAVVGDEAIKRWDNTTPVGGGFTVYLVLNTFKDSIEADLLGTATFNPDGAGVLGFGLTDPTSSFDTIATQSSKFNQGVEYYYACLVFDTNTRVVADVGTYIDYYYMFSGTRSAIANPDGGNDNSISFAASRFAANAQVPWTIYDTVFIPIPEPTAMALLALGAAAVGLRRRFRK